MKRIPKKRLIYYSLNSGNCFIGGEEYDADLTDESILDFVHEVGKTEWRPSNWIGPGDKWEKELWLLKPSPLHPEIQLPLYRITVETFYQYQKSWYDGVIDMIKGFLRH